MLYIARVLTLALFPGLAFASGPTGDVIDLTNHFAGFLAIAIFVVAYALVMAEESIHLPKSKPVLIAAGLIWLIIAVSYQGTGQEQFRTGRAWCVIACWIRFWQNRIGRIRFMG